MEHGQLRHGPGQHHVEPAQPSPVVGLCRSDLRRLDDNDAVELEALGDGGRHELDRVVRIVAVQAEMVAPYLGVREDLGRAAYASYCAELLDRFTAEGDVDYHDLFSLFDDTLERLCNDDDPRLAVRYYEMQLLDKVGFRPELAECVVSRETVQPEDQFFVKPCAN